MKKKFLVFIFVSIGIALGLGLLYLIYLEWQVFGFWNLTWTGLATTLSGVFLGQLIGSRVEIGGMVRYNPKEWPKFINILICVLVGYYLYTIIAVPTVSPSDYKFGMFYLVILSGVPILWAIFKLFRDRNDFVEIDNISIRYRDNQNSGSIELLKIKSVEGTADLKIDFVDGSAHEIPLSKMNFNTSDRLSLIKDINARLPKAV
jgi:hypothetical protein